MTPEKWTTSFLEGLRQQGDPEADRALQLVLTGSEGAGIKQLFATMDSNNDVPPASLFPVLAEFFADTSALPTDVDLPRILRGEEVFNRHAYSGALSLLTKSLPEGYQAPNLAIILNISGDLRTQTYRRLLATLQTVVNVSTLHGFQDGGRAVITAQKLRLLHAGIRHIVRKVRPDFEPAYGVPVNQEDMLATILGFSLLVIEGWRRLNAGLTPDEENDYLYLWLVFGRMMGIHPPDSTSSLAYLPADVAEAEAFYRQYRERHYVDGARNPDGVALATANLKTLVRIIPTPLRFLGMGFLPRICMIELMGKEACGRLNIYDTPGHALMKFLLLHLHKILHPKGDRGKPPEHERLGMMIFQGLIDASFGERVTFTVPTDIQELRTMVASQGTRSH